MVSSNFKVLISAGPTREYFDSVRFLSNPSTGKMGYAIAEAAIERGFKVDLVSGPVSLKCPLGVNRISVETGEQMLNAVDALFPKCDLFISVAAVMDFRPISYENTKLKKDGNSIKVELSPTIDILKTMSDKKESQILVGFSAETNDLEENAKKKLFSKKLDWIVANLVGGSSGGFGSEMNEVVLLGCRGERVPVSSNFKKEVAKKILEKVIVS